MVAPIGAVKVADQVDAPAAQSRRERLRDQGLQDFGGELVADELAPGDHVAEAAQAPLELAAVERFAGLGLDLALQVHHGVGEVDEAQFTTGLVLDDVRPKHLGFGLPGHEQAKDVPIDGIARVLPQGPVDGGGYCRRP